MESKRIKISQLGNETLIEILPIKDVLKTRLLFAWLLVWTLCGIIVFSQFFSNSSKEEKLMMAVWMAFWGYFEYKISLAYTWRKSGGEKILLAAESLTYEQYNGQKTSKKEFVIENISELQCYEFGKNNFSDSLQSSYWVKGNETVFFSYFGAKVGLGLQLTSTEAKQLYQTLHKWLKKRN